MQAPSFKTIDTSDYGLTGPMRCPDCNGAVALDGGVLANTDTVCCPYCLAVLRLPGPDRKICEECRSKMIVTQVRTARGITHVWECPICNLIQIEKEEVCNGKRG